MTDHPTPPLGELELLRTMAALVSMLLLVWETPDAEAVRSHLHLRLRLVHAEWDRMREEARHEPI